MSRVENRRKRLFKRRRTVLLLVMVVALLGLTFYVKSQINSKKNITISTNNNTKKDPLVKPSTNANMNFRESKVNSTYSTTTNVYNSDGHKIAYLTFDDGPSTKTTPAILKILDQHNIKATFFIVGDMAIINPNLVEMEAKDGQSIGNHSYSHNYKHLYSNTNTFIDDMNKCDSTLKLIIGSSFNSKLVRFPGGSFGAKMAPFRVAIKNAGYHYIDWNDITGDADGHDIPVNKLLSNIKEYTKGKQHVVILMHDASDKGTTVQALPQVIEYLISQGYSFNILK